MLKYSCLFLVIIIFISCESKKDKTAAASPQPANSDTLVIARNADDIAGSAYHKRASRYNLVINNDTSLFSAVFSEAKETGKVSLSIRFNKTKSWRLHKKELELILAQALKDYNTDSLNRIFIGRLYLSGDLAIAVTQEYLKKYGENYSIKTTDYKRIEQFLLETAIAEEFNSLLTPYNKSIYKFSVEKAFFTTREELLKNCTVEGDSSAIPERILDCITGFSLQKAG